MKKATIVDLRGSWGSGIAILVVKEGKKLKEIPADNAPLVRALDAMFAGVIAPGHTVNMDAIRGKKIVYEMDEMGLMLGSIGPG